MIVLLGANHRSAPLPMRERMAVSENELPEWIGRLTDLDGVDEAMVLSTCNRFEVVANVREARAGVAAIRGLLTEERGIAAKDVDRYCYHFTRREAVKQLFRVTSGLDSMILGEPQITGQVKKAYRAAQDAGATGAIVERAIQHALAAAKRVRSETDIARHPVSIASAAVNLARQIFSELAGRSALLLGAGKMAALVATHLTAHGVERLVVTSRTYNSAVGLAARFGGEAINWEDARSALRGVDIVVSGTAAPNIVLTRETVQEAMRGRRSGALFLIDIAVPRDIEPECNQLSNVYLYDVDDLQGVVEENVEGRQSAAKLAEDIIEHEVDAFDRWVQSLSVAPTIVSLRDTLLQVGANEVRRFRGRLGPLTTEQEGTVNELARSIIQKILHRPIRQLKASVQGGNSEGVARAIRDMFGVEAALPQPEEPDAERKPRARAGAGPQRVLDGGKED
jgi:glutamyl-tRNA reductase